MNSSSATSSSPPLSSTVSESVYPDGANKIFDQISTTDAYFNTEIETNPRRRYQLMQKIGKGGFSSVFKAYDVVTLTTVAIKIIDLEDVGDELDEVNQEILIMSHIQCPQLIKYYASHVIGLNLWIIMEYLEAGSIADLIKDIGPLDEPSISYVLSELLHGLSYFHSERKIHRDVKGSNILLSADAGVKLADFGVTGQLTDSMNKMETTVGTPFWMSPEVITESAYDGCADIWSVGITAIELAQGLPPYALEVHPMQVIFLIPKNPPPVLEGDFSSELKDFVSQCLQKASHRRPAAMDLLQHPFIVNAKKPESFTEIVQNRIIKNQHNESSESDMFQDDSFHSNTSRDRSDSGWDFTMRTNQTNMSHNRNLSSQSLHRTASCSSILSDNFDINSSIKEWEYSPHLEGKKEEADLGPTAKKDCTETQVDTGDLH
jgi:serine/threonine-protein kinase 24/25/MST4